MYKIRFTWNCEIEIVSTKDVVEIDVLGLVKGNGPILVSNFESVASGYRSFAVGGGKSNECAD